MANHIATKPKNNEKLNENSKESMANATAMREKKTDSDANIAALGKAIAAIEAGMGTSFLPTAAAKSLLCYTAKKADLPDLSRRKLGVEKAVAANELADTKASLAVVLGVLKKSAVKRSLD